MFEFTIHINTESDEDFTDDFLASTPIPQSLNGMPLYSPEAWVKEFTVLMLEKRRLKGAKLKAAAQHTTDPTIVTAT